MNTIISMVKKSFWFTLLGMGLLISKGVAYTPEVGQNYMFWVLGQGFFSGYYQSSATLNVIGENCYVFTEDALVRDIAISPFEPKLLVAATNSGIFVSTDYGATWKASNGSGSKLLPLEPVKNKPNIDEIAPQHLQRVHTIAFESQDYWWAGVEGIKGAYQSKNRGETWSQKGSGMSTFDPDGPKNPLPNDNPPVYKVYFPVGGEDPWAATLAGLYFRPGSRWKLRGNGLPDPLTTDWPSIPVYDVIVHDSVIVAGTANGLFRGSVSEEFNNTLPLEGGTVTIDTTFLTYVVVEVLDSVKTDSFYIDLTSDSTLIIGDDTLNISWVYEYTTSLDTISWNLTLGLSDISSAGLSLAKGQTINIADDSTGTMWKNQVTENSDLEIFTVNLTNEQVYFFDDALFDDNEPDSTTYKIYNTNHLIVYKGGGEAVTNITVDSTGLIYYTTATGAYSVSINGGTPTSLGLSNVTINDIALSADESVLYAATTQGLQKIEIGSNPDWTEITPQIHMLNAENSVSYVTNSIAVAGNDTIYVACGTAFFSDPRIVTYKTGGVLASFDGGNTWSPKNVGLTHRSVNIEDVANIKASFDNTTAADTTKGLYEFLTTWYGASTDIDNDDKIVILVADLDDNAYNATDDLVIQGYFNPGDQLLTDIQPNSNQLDIIYLDSNPLDPGEGQEGIARAFSRLICYNYDIDEEEWVLIGLEHFASYIAGYKTMPDDSMFTIFNNNSLKYGDNENMNVEFDQSFTIMEYLYEHYLNEDPFSLSPNSIKSMSAIVQETGNGTAGLNSVLGLATEGAKDFGDVFTDWALAVHFDNPDTNLNYGLYGFSNINVKVNPSTYPWGITAGVAPYNAPISNWAVKYMQSEKWVNSGNQNWTDKAPGFNGKTLVFNGSDDSDIDLVIIKQKRKDTTARDSSAFIEYVELNDTQNRTVYTNWSDFGSDSTVVTDSSHLKKYQYFAMVAVCRDAGSETGGSYVVDDEIDVPDGGHMAKKISINFTYLRSAFDATGEVIPDSSVFDMLIVTVPDSIVPGRFSYSDSTSWTYTLPDSEAVDIVIINDSTTIAIPVESIESVELIFDWMSESLENTPSKGSFKIRSPSGTSKLVLRNGTTGSYTKIFASEFDDQSPVGDWIFSIYDKYDSWFSLAVDQNSDLINFLDLYAFSNFQIYSDGAFGSLANEGGEGPLVEVYDGDSVLTSFIIPRYYDRLDTTGAGYVYHETFNLESLLPTTVSEFWFIGSAESLGGNITDSDSILVVAIKVSSSAGKFVMSKLGGFSISIPPYTIENEGYITVIENTGSGLTPETVIPVGDVLTLGPSGIVLGERISIEFDISRMDITSINIEKLDIVSIDDGKATSLDAIVDKENWVVSADVSEMGLIQLVVNPAKREVDILPTEYALYQNYPNPFNPTTTMRFDLPEEVYVFLRIYDILGREVADLSPGFMQAGTHTVRWSGLDDWGKQTASGVYFYHLMSKNFTQTRKMILVK